MNMVEFNEIRNCFHKAAVAAAVATTSTATAATATATMDALIVYIFKTFFAFCRTLKVCNYCLLTISEHLKRIIAGRFYFAHYPTTNIFFKICCN